MIHRFTKSFLFCALLTIGGCASTHSAEQTPESASAPAESTSSESSMMMPEDALKSPGGYAYIVLVKGNGTKPAHTAAVNVRLRVRSVDGNIVDEDTGTIAVAHSTPFLEEMIGLMEIGETIRVWGESQARIWEIELLSVDTTYDAPEDAAPPMPPVYLNSMTCIIASLSPATAIPSNPARSSGFTPRAGNPMAKFSKAPKPAEACCSCLTKHKNSSIPYTTR